MMTREVDFSNRSNDKDRITIHVVALFISTWIFRFDLASFRVLYARLLS
ncbi:hypothetical protein [Neorhodopirellula pilleata]|nr:hypothetical protein [Neorhodopirellula pilleata]